MSEGNQRLVVDSRGTLDNAIVVDIAAAGLIAKTRVRELGLLIAVIARSAVISHDWGNIRRPVIADGGLRLVALVLWFVRVALARESR